MADQYWTTRLSRPDETNAVLDLVRTVHGDRYPELNRSYWRWRYLEGGQFRAGIVLAEHDGDAIGIQPVALFDFMWDNNRLKGAMFTGVLTHPAHRRRGVFRSLVTRAQEHAASRGALFCMTMPNEASLPGFRRFGGWAHPGPIPLYVKALDGAAMLRPRVGRAAAALLGWAPRVMLCRSPADRSEWSVDVQAVDRMPDELDSVAEAFARECGTLHILRSAAYWNWRYCDKPASAYRTLVARRDGELAGAVVTSVEQHFGMDVGMILDLVVSGGSIPIRQLLRVAEEDLAERGLGLITCQATSPVMQLALRGEGFVRPPVRLLPKRFHFVYRLTGAEAMPLKPDVLSDWHLTFGDSDNT